MATHHKRQMTLPGRNNRFDDNPSDAETQRLLQWLDTYLGPSNLKFEGPTAADLARGLATSQRRRWDSLLEIVEGGSRTAHANVLARHLRTVILEGFSEPAIFNLPNGAVRLTSSLPILQSDAPSEMVIDHQSFAVEAVAQIFLRCRDFFAARDDAEAGRITLALAVAESLLDERFGAGFLEEFKTESDAHVAKLRADVSTLINETRELKNSLEKDGVAAQSSLDDLQARSDLANQQFQNFISSCEGFLEEKISTWDAQRIAEVAAIRSEVKEFTKVETSINLWRTKARWHTFNYIALGSLFGLGLIAITVYILFGFATGFVESLKAVPAEHQFVAIGLLAIPTLAIAWLLRFVARLALQNLSLAHDARQRHAQVNTYLRLLGDVSKPITEKERILALAALFRPLPGQGPDDVNPPTIADLLKDAATQVSGSAKASR